jgi:hypothetical protein
MEKVTKEQAAAMIRAERLKKVAALVKAVALAPAVQVAV